MFASCKTKKASGIETVPIRPDKSDLSSLNEIYFGSLFIDGCAARMKGNVEEALKIFNKCLQINPSSTPVKYELAMINKVMGVNDLALYYAKECAQAEPKNIWYQLLLADCYRTLHQYQNSVKVQENLVKNFPNNLEFKENLAIEYAQIGQYAKSLVLYDELEKLYGLNEQITINKVKILSKQNKQNEVEREIKRLIASNPDNSRYLGYLAEHYENTKDIEKAKEVYYKIIEVDPTNPTVRLALSDYYKMKGDEARSYEELKLAFMNPDLDVRTKYNINKLYYNTAVDHPESVYFSQGLELASILIKVHPASYEAYLVYADFMFFDKNFEKAAEYYYRAAQKDKSEYGIWERLMICDKKLGRYDSLEKHSYEAVELFPGQPTIYLYNGLANMQIKNYKKAAEVLKDGMAYVTNDNLMLSGFLSNLGDAYFYMKDYKNSDKSFDDALKINPDNESVLNNYAYYLALRKEQLEKAEKLSKRSIEIKPNEANYMDTYGWILFLQAKYTQAEEWLQKATVLNPGNPNILEHYADCLFKLNKIDMAIKYWNQAIQSGGNTDRITKKIREKNISE